MHGDDGGLHVQSLAVPRYCNSACMFPDDCNINSSEFVSISAKRKIVNIPPVQMISDSGLLFELRM